MNVLRFYLPYLDTFEVYFLDNILIVLQALNVNNQNIIHIWNWMRHNKNILILDKSFFWWSASNIFSTAKLLVSSFNLGFSTLVISRSPLDNPNPIMIGSMNNASGPTLILPVPLPAHLLVQLVTLLSPVFVVGNSFLVHLGIDK